MVNGVDAPLKMPHCLVVAMNLIIHHLDVPDHILNFEIN